MLKVCGVTFDHTLNYGSSLQAYALQTAIESLTICGEKCTYKLIPLLLMPDYPHDAISIAQKIAKKTIRKVYLYQFSKFEKPRMKYAVCSSIANLDSLNNGTDVFVCGSDVIWNPSENMSIGAYYLNFAHKYKFSYAASFGRADVSKVIGPQIQQWLCELNGISCREKSSEEILKKLTRKDISIVVDPIMLLNIFEWNKIAAKKKDEKKYIFVYMTHIIPELEQFLQHIKNVTGLPIIKAVSKPKEGIKQGVIIPQTPQRWLQQLRDAEYVITNSFHATVFSVIFHKKFFTVVQGKKDQGIYIRMNDFLESINLENRIFSTVPDIIDTSEIDFSQADMILEQKRKESLDFLQKNLEAAYQEKQKLVQKGQTV